MAYDGGWVFVSTGSVQDFEEPAAYQRRQIRDRFTSDMLERYAQRLGIDPFDEAKYGPESVMVSSSVPDGLAEKSLKEVQAWLDIRPGRADSARG